ncbi:PIII-type proteinase [Lactococcus lactis]|nr:PIII-type proteinase [Lactococcus lactis]
MNSMPPRLSSMTLRPGLATITGKVKHPTTTLQVDGKQIPIKDDLTFSFTLDLGTLGQKPFGVVVGDTTQNKTFPRSVDLHFGCSGSNIVIGELDRCTGYTNDPKLPDYRNGH